MRLLTRRSVVLAAIAVLVLGGLALALLDERTIALAAAFLLAGLAAVQATRAEASSRRAERAVSRVERSAKRLESAAASQHRRLSRQSERLSSMHKSVRASQARALEALDLAQRRYLNLAESERLEAARRHQELLSRSADGAGLRAELAEQGRQVARVLGEQGKSVVREIAETVRRETCQIEAMIHLAPRVEARALLPASGAWALDARSLAHLVDLVLAKRPSLVVELGSGTSTVYLGYVLERWGGRLVSIDHDERFAELTRAELSRHGLESHVEVRLAPLAQQTIAGAEALWYSLDALEDLEGVEVLLVDGPPGNVAPRARQHAVPALAARLAPGALVLLDDAPRPDEREIARAWREAHGLEQLDDGVSRIAVLRVP